MVGSPLAWAAIDSRSLTPSLNGLNSVINNEGEKLTGQPGVAACQWLTLPAGAPGCRHQDGQVTLRTTAA